MKKNLIYLLFLVLFASSTSFAQNGGKVGLSALVQQSTYGILIPVWFSDRFVIAPSLDIRSAKDVGSDIGFGLAPRFYFNPKNENFYPYAGFRVGAIVNKAPAPFPGFTAPASKVDFIFGGAFGGEYFLAENFSFGVEGQANFTKSDDFSNRFGNPGGMNFNLGTAFLATIYF